MCGAILWRDTVLPALTLLLEVEVLCERDLVLVVVFLTFLGAEAFLVVRFLLCAGVFFLGIYIKMGFDAPSVASIDQCLELLPVDYSP